MSQTRTEIPCKCGGILKYYNIGFDDGYSCSECHRMLETYEVKDMKQEDKGKYDDEVVYGLLQQVQCRQEFYQNQMKKLLAEYGCTENWKLLPESQLRQYIIYESTLNELCSLYRDLEISSVHHINDPEARMRKWNAQTLIDMGR